MYFCPQCLQSHMAPEAKLYHMRCKTCFECPSCSCHMALRAVAGTGDRGASPSPSSSTTGDKVHVVTEGIFAGFAGLLTYNLESCLLKWC